MIRIVKLAAYVLFAVLLPLWLYVSTNQGLAEKHAAKDKEGQGQVLNVTINGGHLDTLFAQYGKTFQNKTDASPNPNLESNIDRLTRISIANATTLQGLLNDGRSISFEPITVDIKQPVINQPRPAETPVYVLADTSTFPTFIIPDGNISNLVFSNRLAIDVHLFLDNMLQVQGQQIDTLLLRNDVLRKKINAYGNPGIMSSTVESGMDIILQHSPVNTDSKTPNTPFYIVGYFFRQPGDATSIKVFRIPVLVGKRG